jgi:hypothetical protein
MTSYCSGNNSQQVNDANPSKKIKLASASD